jgi:phosphoribosylamine--glycine ligase
VVPALPIQAVGIVLASAGYPGEVVGEGRITVLDETAMLPDAPGVLVFHSGTFHETGTVYRATGGRVVTVVATGPDLASARDRAEHAADRIAWPGMQRRHDIGADVPAPAVGAAR